MSFVGPRPALWNQYDLVEEREKYQANNLRPGITGFAQISGRDKLTIKKKAELDGLYVKEINLFNDIKLILKTILVVIKREGNVEGGIESMSNQFRSDEHEEKK